MVKGPEYLFTGYKLIKSFTCFRSSPSKWKLWEFPWEKFSFGEYHKFAVFKTGFVPKYLEIISIIFLSQEKSKIGVAVGSVKSRTILLKKSFLNFLFNKLFLFLLKISFAQLIAFINFLLFPFVIKKPFFLSIEYFNFFFIYFLLLNIL